MHACTACTAHSGRPATYTCAGTCCTEVHTKIRYPILFWCLGQLVNMDFAYTFIVVHITPPECTVSVKASQVHGMCVYAAGGTVCWLDGYRQCTRCTAAWHGVQNHRNGLHRRCCCLQHVHHILHGGCCLVWRAGVLRRLCFVLSRHQTSSRLNAG